MLIQLSQEAYSLPFKGREPAVDGTPTSMAGPTHKPKWFRCLLGSRARTILSHQGVTPDTTTLLLAASGGPRWIGLAGLDRALAKFFTHRTGERLPLLGASSGSWRVSALCCDNDGCTYEELLHEYIEQQYEGSPTPEEISQVCREYLMRVFTEERIGHALRHPRLQVNFTTAIGRTERPSKWRTAGAILSALGWNALGREHLKRSFKRGLFSALPHPPNSPLSSSWDQIPTTQIPLSKENFQQALLASGSIPLVLEGESGIAGSPPGHHLDGGLVDYHFELEEGAPIFYPHFSEDPIPGWMDRFPPRRRIGDKARSQLCLFLPSAEALALFPTGDYPCRHDFRRFPNKTRIKLWWETAEVTRRMESELTAYLENGDLLEVAESLER